ncbi:hypothetical protein BVC80_41g47 [Macleaya cordata]|uniref:Uncharacterized protein n=1 Tax=Macleaya cordata TaxID=56857 RepID=A0A200QMS9_MACCD|nr:hypothetical protein BVC80_41g47 [Macleaya cordata]
MAVELLGFSKMDEQMAIQEAAAAGLRSMEHFIRFLSSLLRELAEVTCELSQLTSATRPVADNFCVAAIFCGYPYTRTHTSNYWTKCGY